MHGGHAPVGAANGNFRHGRYSQFLPSRLTERYDASVQDPELLELSSLTALADARIADLLERVDTGESGELWSACQKGIGEVQAAVERMNGARRTGDQEKQAEAECDLTDSIDMLAQLILAGVADYAAWKEVFFAAERRRKLSDSERKRKSEMQTMIDSKRLMTLMSALVNVIKTHVTDAPTLSAISTDIRGLLSAGNGAGAGAG